MATLLSAELHVLLLSLVFSLGLSESSGDGDSSSNTGGDILSTSLIVTVVIVVLFIIVIIALLSAIVFMCKRRSTGSTDIRPKASNTYRGFSQERTQSPPESTVIPSSTRSSRSHSHSHLPTSPISIHPTATPTTTPQSSITSPPRSLSVSLERHTYHHLRQHEGMKPLPIDYPQHKYANLGPRSETPPQRPPKSAQLQSIMTPHSDSVSIDPPVSATAPPWSQPDEKSRALASESVHVGNHVNSSVQTSTGHSPRAPSSEVSNGVPLEEDGSNALPRRSIYDTMIADSAHRRLVTRQTASSTRETHNESPRMDGEEGPSKQRSGDYDQLTLFSSPPRKQQKANVRIFDDPDYSPPQEQAGGGEGGGSDTVVDTTRGTQPGSVRVVDPRYAGDYERHTDYVSPEIEVPREQLLEKYQGDYERDPTYFLKNPTRSLSVSAATSHVLLQEQKQRSSSLTCESRPDKYRGDYERSEDYFIPPQLQNGNTGMGREDDYVLEPDPNYTGAYERHPDYVPPLVKRSSKSRIQILTKDSAAVSSRNHASSHTDRPSHVPHEYAALAKATKDPPQQYTTLNSRPSGSTAGSMPKDSRV